MIGYLWDTIKLIWKFLQGKKSFGVALAAVVYGLYAGKEDAVLLGLGLFGVRHGIQTEIAKLITSRKK